MRYPARGDRTGINRRRFLAALLAGATLPLWARAQSTNPDVVIVGAGAAGLAAARALAEAGLTFVLIEAKDRIGGRAFTDTTSFGLPFDHGCSWLHHSDRNPFTPIAEAAGFTLLPHDDAGEAVFVDDRPASDEEMSAFDDAWDAAIGAVRKVGVSGEDIAPGPSMPVNLPWSNVSKSWIGPLSMGADVEDFSAHDWWALDDTDPDLMVREGYGTIVALYGKDVPVSLSTPATLVRWGGSGVSVETPSGTINAKTCIVTVSTGVLASEAIRFDPPLPVEKQEAIAGLPMGLLAKIPLQFEGTRFGLTPNDWLSYAANDERLCYFLNWPFDMDLMIGWVGGRFGWELSAAGEDAAVDFGLGELRRIFGGDVDRHFVKGGFTAWANDPDVRGGYAYQRPGAAGARTALSRALDDRLFFAGEATAGSFAMTCGGAFRSGERAAREILSALG
ncbi:MAG: NAD(P)/FAD-dependent oxidoreductase [Dongiaceae bacterium]